VNYDRAHDGATIMHNHHRLVLATLALAAMFSLPAAAQPTQAWTQVGSLSCKVNPNIGFIIVGHQPLECLFTPNERTPPQAYDGAINTVGLNVGISAGGVLGWAVFAPTTGIPAGALAGDYVGVSGDIGIGVGAGANVLVGGSGRTFALQPLSLQGSVAFNVVLGVSALTLRWH
jgi:Protein of unknown function (DUF992)